MKAGVICHARMRVGSSNAQGLPHALLVEASTGDKLRDGHHCERVAQRAGIAGPFRSCDRPACVLCGASQIAETDDVERQVQLDLRDQPRVAGSRLERLRGDRGRLGEGVATRVDLAHKMERANTRSRRERTSERLLKVGLRTNEVTRVEAEPRSCDEPRRSPITVGRRRQLHSQLQKVGRRDRCAARPPQHRRLLELACDGGIGLDRAQRGMPRALLGLGHDRRQPAVQGAPLLGAGSFVEGRREQRVRELDAAVRDGDDARPPGCAQGAGVDQVGGRLRERRSHEQRAAGGRG